MRKYRQIIKDFLFTSGILLLCFFLNLFVQFLFRRDTLVPMIFVLGVFFVSTRTQGYFWGIAASLLSVLAVNFAFTIPYYAIDLMGIDEIETRKEKIMEVTKEDIMLLASKVNIDTIFLLGGDKKW